MLEKICIQDISVEQSMEKNRNAELYAFPKKNLSLYKCEDHDEQLL